MVKSSAYANWEPNCLKAGKSDKEQWKNWRDLNVLAVEMEAAGLYTLAAKYNRKALTILTISDHLLTGEETTAEERQTTFNDMIILALETAIRLPKA